eukprot:6186234-Pleurochrysis_carterae.AAC.4
MESGWTEWSLAAKGSISAEAAAHARGVHMSTPHARAARTRTHARARTHAPHARARTHAPHARAPAPAQDSRRAVVKR